MKSITFPMNHYTRSSGYRCTVVGRWKLRFYENPLFQNTAFINNHNIDPTANSFLCHRSFLSPFYRVYFLPVKYQNSARCAAMARPNVTLQMKASYFYLANTSFPFQEWMLRFHLSVASRKERKVKFTCFVFFQKLSYMRHSNVWKLFLQY